MMEGSAQLLAWQISATHSLPFSPVSHVKPGRTKVGTDTGGRQLGIYGGNTELLSTRDTRKHNGAYSTTWTARLVSRALREGPSHHSSWTSLPLP